MTAFAAIDAIAATAVDATFGELVRILPMRSGKYSAGGADPDRQERDLYAILTEDHGLQRTDGDRIGGNFGVNLEAGPIRVSLPKTSFSSRADWPREKDRIQALDRDGQPIYEIARDPLPDNASRLVLHCTRLKTV